MLTSKTESEASGEYPVNLQKRRYNPEVNGSQSSLVAIFHSGGRCVYYAYCFAFAKMLCSCETLVNSAFNDWKNAIGSDKSRAFQNPPESNGSSGKISNNEQTRGIHKRAL